MAKPDRYFQQSMTTKLFMFCLLLIVVFGVIIAVMVSAFRNVDELTDTIVERDVTQIIQNGQLARDLSGVLSETHLLVSSFYRDNKALEQGQRRLLETTDHILAGEMADSQRVILNDLRSFLSLLLQQCRTLNTLAEKIREVDAGLHDSLSQLEEVVSGKMVNLVLAGENSVAYEQIGVMIPSYREVILQIMLSFNEYKPISGEEFDSSTIVTLLEKLHLRLKSLLASDADVTVHGKKLLAGVTAFQGLITDFELETEIFQKRHNLLNRTRQQALIAMKRTDERSVSAAQMMKKEIILITGRTVDFLVIITILVALVMVAAVYAFFLYHIRRPMDRLLRGITSVGDGDLQTIIQLERNDEWLMVEDSINRMICELRESYQKLHAKNDELLRTHDAIEQNLIALESEISQRELAEKETERLQQQLQHAQKMEAIGTLAGGVAHDFNNLLQGIQGYTELVLMKSPSDNTQELQEVLRAAKRGGELTRQLLTFSRKVESNLVVVEINTIVYGFMGMIERIIPKMIKVVLELNAEHGVVCCDTSQIEQVLMNLAVNARDVMPDGGRITISTKDVMLNKLDTFACPEMVPGDYVLLQVADTGLGMDQQTRTRIFDPFFTTKDVGKGTGLGLAIVYGIVKNHQGHILCESEPQKGTTFSIYLPACAEGKGKGVSAEQSQAELAGGIETILLVDDEPTIRDIGRQILTHFGYTVLYAENGEQALETYRREKERVDLVILDIIMPGMGGEQCLKQLRADDPEVKVVIASGYSDVSDRDFMRQGACGRINKPYDISEILAVVRNALDG